LLPFSFFLDNGKRGRLRPIAVFDGSADRHKTGKKKKREEGEKPVPAHFSTGRTAIQGALVLQSSMPQLSRREREKGRGEEKKQDQLTSTGDPWRRATCNYGRI